MLIDYPASSGAAETYTADESKIAVSLQRKEMSLLSYWG
jgi:hypothetical protein